MADDILIRLRAEADTTAMKEAVAGLQRIADMQRKNGASEKEAQSYSIAQWAKIEAAARKAGVSVQQYFANVEAKQRAAVEAGKRNAAIIEQQTAALGRQSTVANKLTRELGAMAAGYLTISAVTRTVSDSITQFAKLDTQLRRMQNQAGVTREEIDSLRPMFDRLSKASGRSITDLITGFDELRENANLSIPETRKVYAAIVQGADAAGVSVKDMSNSFATTMLNMGVKGTDVAKVMDQMAMASADLRLDFGQMVGQMPKLTEAFGSIGYKGEQGNAAMLAWVSTLRKVTSGSGEAGQAAARMAEQVAGPAMAKALGMPQQELERIVEQAKDEGKDVFSVVTGLLLRRAQLTGKSVESLLRDMSVRERRYWRAASEGRDQALEATQRLQRVSEGASKKMSDNIRKGPEKAIADLTNAWSKFKDSLGETVDSIGVTSALKGVSDFLDNIIRLMAVVRGERSWADYQKEEAERDAAKTEESEAEKWRRLHPTEGIGTRRTGRRGAGQAPTEGIVPMPRGRPADADDETIPEGATPIGPGAPRASEPLPNWMQRQLTPGGGPGGTGGFGYRFAGGDHSGGGTIAGRNWQHDLLSGSPESTNIEDRRTTEHQTDAVQANTAAIQHLTDLLDDVDGVGGDLATQLGGGSIGGGGGGGRGRGGGGVAQRFSGGGGGGMEGGGGRAGTGAGGSGGGGMGGGGGGNQAGGSGGGFEGGTGLPGSIAPLREGGSKAAGKNLGGNAEDPQAQFLQNHRAKLMEELNGDPRKMQAFKELVAAETGGQGPGDQQAFIETTLDRWAARGQNVQQGIASNYYGNNPRSRTPSAQLNKDFGGMMDKAKRGSAMYPGATGNASNEPGNMLLDKHRARGELAGVGPGGEGYVYEPNEQDNAFRRGLKQAGGQTTGTAGTDGANTASASGNVTSSIGKGTTRNRPLDPRLQGAFEEAAAASGVKVDVWSGGQTTSRDPRLYKKPGGWTGSLRHNDTGEGGGAADIDIQDPKTGKNIPRGDPRYLKFIEEAAARGAGGSGFGYMGGARAHLGITGAGGKVGQGLGTYTGDDAERAAVNRGLKRFKEGGNKYTLPKKDAPSNVDTSNMDRGKEEGYSRFLGKGRGEKKDEDLDRASGKGRGGGKKDEDLDKASGKGRQQKIEVNHKMDLSSRTQFARRDREYDKGAQSALNRASENSHADIGVA